ncbi:MAG: nitrous oxide reductase accessory protein NosL [Microscillaceae bacterium]|jgi:nitrous oxide reductase accessory protein NosL|nr:nitrous oxide reductase accessory protein NosL [Microscillaceae bacterium]
MPIKNFKKTLNGLFISFLAFACQSNSPEKKAIPNSTRDTKYDCAHCAMPANEYPKWNVKLTTADQKLKWFCSPRCMLMEVKHPQGKLKNFSLIQLVEYYETRRIKAEDAFFVIGSKVLGPMGNDFVPVKDSASAVEFKNDHEGKQIIRFKDIDTRLIEAVLK